MKILFCAVSGLGHINPLLPLADACTARGHEVAFATAPDMTDHLERHGYHLHAAGPTDAERSALAAELRGDDAGAGIAFAFGVLFSQIHAPRMLPDLLRVMDEFRPALLVCESAELATPLAGTLRGAPWLHHSYGVLRPARAWELATASLARLWAEHGLQVPERAGMFDGEYVDVCPPALQTDEIASVPRRRSLRIVDAPAGPRRLPSRPHVLVTFGTVFNRQQALVDVVGTISALPIDATVTLGPGASLPKAAPDNVRVVEYAPLSDVLPTCAAVITHGGSGTVLASLAHGVPLLAMPQGADNTLNAERVEAAGAGLQVTDIDQLPTALDRLLTDQTFQDAAATVADQINAMPAPDDVAAELATAYAGG